MAEESKYRSEFNQNYLPSLTEYFSQPKLDKTLSSYKYLIEDLKKIEKVSSDSTYKHVMSKKNLFLSKNAKNICRSGIQFKHMRNFILKMFNIEFSPEDYNNKAKTVLKGRTFADLEAIAPTFSPKTFEETIPFHYLNEKGISALKEIAWLLNDVIPKIEYCPTLLSLGSLLLLFLSKEETYEVLRMMIELDQTDTDLNKLRWHFRYNILDNIQMDSNIKTCIYELSSNPQQFKNFEKMGLPLTSIIREIVKKFFLNYINFAGIMRILPFFLLEGVKGIYRIIYAIVYYCNQGLEEDQKAGKIKILKDQKTREELMEIFKEKSNKITDFVNLFDFATKWNLTHTNNNYIYQVVPPAIKNNLADIDKMVHIPSFEPESSILSPEQITKLWEFLPQKLKLCDCILLFKKGEYSNDDLNTIYQSFEDLDEKTILFVLIQTDKDEIFGFIMEQSIKLSDNIEYKDLPLSYLFSISPELKFYEHKNKDDKIVCFEPGAIRFGYGNYGPAITINFGLNEGTTEKNSVFGDDICLIKDYSNEGFFNIRKIEIYMMQ